MKLVTGHQKFTLENGGILSSHQQTAEGPASLLLPRTCWATCRRVAGQRRKNLTASQPPCPGRPRSGPAACANSCSLLWTRADAPLSRCRPVAHQRQEGDRGGALWLRRPAREKAQESRCGLSSATWGPPAQPGHLPTGGKLPGRGELWAGAPAPWASSSLSRGLSWKFPWLGLFCRQ